jgi:HEAT repeat protein
MRYAKSRGLDLLRENIQETKCLIKNDLLSVSNKERERALIYISELKLSEFDEDVLDIFLHSEELELRAAYTMQYLQMYEGIKYLVSKPENPTKYFEILRYLQKNKKAHDSILPLLDSPDSEIRWKSAYALAESGDKNLVPYVKKLIKDQDSEVRKQAACMGFFLKEGAYEEVYSDLVTLLSDKDQLVRIEVVCMFAWNKDIVCAEAMLDLLRDDTLEERSHSRIWQAMHSLSGNYFGYYHGSDGWKPTTENNKISIKKFEEWIANNKVK